MGYALATISMKHSNMGQDTASSNIKDHCPEESVRGKCEREALLTLDLGFKYRYVRDAL